jgi:hypothetical protein
LGHLKNIRIPTKINFQKPPRAALSPMLLGHLKNIRIPTKKWQTKEIHCVKTLQDPHKINLVKNPRAPHSTLSLLLGHLKNIRIPTKKWQTKEIHCAKTLQDPHKINLFKNPPHSLLNKTDAKRHIDYFSKGPKSNWTDCTQKRRSFQVKSI